MAKIHVRLVDAFTTTPHTGNPAAVILDGSKLSDQQMQAISREMNVSETAFLLPPTKSGTDLRVRWFNPTGEVPLCGHATIASFHSLAEEGRLGMEKKGAYYFRIDTASGILPVEVMKDNGSTAVMLGTKLPAFQKVPHYKIDLVRVLSISLSEFENRIPMVREDCLYVPVKRLHTLFTMQPNFLLMSGFLKNRGLRGMCVFTTETIERESAVHSRFFAPNHGIVEDPVTGSTHGALAVHLYEQGFVEAHDGRCIVQGEQGDAIGRRGRVKMELQLEDRKPVSVMVGGNAVTVLQGEMLIRD